MLQLRRVQYYSKIVREWGVSLLIWIDIAFYPLLKLCLESLQALYVPQFSWDSIVVMCPPTPEALDGQVPFVPVGLVQPDTSCGVPPGIVEVFCIEPAFKVDWLAGHGYLVERSCGAILTI